MSWTTFYWDNLAALVDDGGGGATPIAYDGGVLTQSTIGPQMEVPAGAFPTVTGSTSVENFFANEQSLTSSGNLDTSTTGTLANPISITEIGARFIDASLSDSTGSNYLIGVGHYWEEAIMMVVAPFPVGTYRYLGNHAGVDYPRGALRLSRSDATTINFEWVESDAAGTGLNTYLLDEINIPLTDAGSATQPKPFYYRFIRNQDSATGTIDLRVYSDGTAYHQQITGVASSVPPDLSGGTQQLSRVGIQTDDRIFWWRSQGSDVATAGTTGVSDFEATPAVYALRTYTPTGPAATSWIDSLYSAQYWQALQFQNASNLGGGYMQFRAVAAETLPSGIGSSLFSRSTWTTITPGTVAGFPIQHELPDLQGRYLGVQLRFQPGTQYPLSFGRGRLGTQIGGVPGKLGQAFWNFSTHITGTITISLNGEGASQGSIPFAPDFVESGSELIRRKSTRFELAYTGTRPLGTLTRRAWTLSWTLSSTNADTLEAFFLARRGGEQVSTLTLPDGSTVKVALVSDLITSWLAPDAKRVSGEVVEVL